MNAIIDADSAKLAGLQIDFLQKLRQGNVTLEQFKWWLNLSKHQRDVLTRGGSFEPNEINVMTQPKFALLVDLGIITVPDDYVHATVLHEFLERNYEEFNEVNDNITDTNFSNPSRILKPGDKLYVRAFQQTVGGATTSVERMAYLATQKAVYIGAQGASLVFEQKRNLLPRGKWYASFDEKKRLWRDAGGYHWVPGIGHRSVEEDFQFGLGNWESAWRSASVFLCFTEVED